MVMGLTVTNVCACVSFCDVVDYSGWVGEYGSSHTWTIPIGDETPESDGEHRDISPFRGTSNTVAWELDK